MYRKTMTMLHDTAHLKYVFSCCTSMALEKSLFMPAYAPYFSVAHIKKEHWENIYDA